jgi:sugar O-acyltransferase (sialic acid O-acetyltransferase NeuD family)
MKKKLIIVGTGLFPEVARCYFDELSDYEVIGFACHQQYKQADTIYGLPLFAVEDLQQTHPPEQITLFVGIGYKQMNKMRQRVYEELKALGYCFANFVYPDVKVWSNTTLGENVFIFEDNTIQPFTKIGNNTILWSGNHIGHHTNIGDHCFISSHVVISGSCKVGNNVFIGVNATLHDSLTISNETLVGAGAVVSKGTKEQQVLLPMSTKPFKKNSEEIGF